VPVVWVDETETIRHPTGEILIFPPKSQGEGNESSLSILFQSGTYDILITGDTDQAGEALLLQQKALPDLEVLVVGHHGAKTSTGAALLNHTKPELAVISVGVNNPYGHPHSETIKRLQMCGCRVRRTDLEGTIIIRG
jgi:competence protein ComEC